ncbi:hypothetical protein RRG08_038415 [Elysia crispata]|uniref:Uncharacterized protein n=1 Tax=Elysia crispata TaxID=231223 RepID=A0AAE1AZG5_9GAST|nr:hypothetical protein RRG08_038415 [Elysia crispata]
MRPTLIQVLLPSLHHQTATIPFQSKGSTVDRLKTIKNSRINKHDLMQRGEDYCRKMRSPVTLSRHVVQNLQLVPSFADVRNEFSGRWGNKEARPDACLKGLKADRFS